MDKSQEYLSFNFKKSSLVDPKGMIVLFHGLGADKEDLMSLASFFQDFDCYSFSAPVRISRRLNLRSRAWYTWEKDFDLLDANQKELETVAKMVIDSLNLRQMRAKGLPIYTLGFSQGGVLALEMARYVSIRKIVMLGSFYPSDRLGDFYSPGTSIFLGHGEKDSVVSILHAQNLKSFLDRNDKVDSVELKIYDQLGHSISQDEIKDVVFFINK